jgi:GNAT superfamily N-acetyltransferase
MTINNDQVPAEDINIVLKLNGGDRLSEVYSFIAHNGSFEVGKLIFAIALPDNISTIEIFRVEEAFQNKGIGTLLLHSYSELVQTQQLTSKICFKTRNNPKVIHLFKKFGFEIIPNDDPCNQLSGFVTMQKFPLEVSFQNE